ncbi:hypothetical protein F4820DRAFT_465775 [Hypoxylon rubiginosum]|uniref:Uncharacterized protein n=1 Tax=Hypoxylon rubiginosum TaxID=110542 RepID=A0ACB9YM45_9PEZI|nr:hypothetical protein F4820DRAFT_465775 [Hypoxylon rubiginosum]
MPPRRAQRAAQPNDDSDSDEGGVPEFDVPNDVQKIANEQPELPTMLKEARKFIRRNKPALKPEDLQRMLPKGDTDATWTAQDEQDLQQTWDNDPLKPHLLAERGNKHLAPLWRYTMRFMGMPVEEIVGPKFNLTYDNSTNEIIDINGEEVHHPHWSAKFCEKLLQLASHPMWLEQPGAMAVCMQYVVKCRTNDQRQMRWPKENHTSDKFFDVFQSVNETFQDGTKPVKKLHDEVDQRMGIPSPYSRLFKTIETLAFRPATGPLRAPAAIDSDVGTYAVSTEDLTRLMKALDQQTDAHGLPLHRQTTFTAAAAKAAKKSYDLPRAADLASAREQVLLGIRREQAKAARLAAQPAPQNQIDQPQPNPQQSGDEGGQQQGDSIPEFLNEGLDDMDDIPPQLDEEDPVLGLGDDLMDYSPQSPVVQQRPRVPGLGELGMRNLDEPGYEDHELSIEGNDDEGNLSFHERHQTRLTPARAFWPHERNIGDQYASKIGTLTKLNDTSPP